jgi:hypothetical protein
MFKTSEIAIKDLPVIVGEAIGLSALGFCFLVFAFCV